MKEHLRGNIQDAVEVLLSSIGEDKTRAGLLDTPARVQKFYNEFFTSGDPKGCTIFQNGLDGVDYDQIILVKDLPVYSFCEHHMLPFFGKAHIAYLPGDSILGLSKFARIVKHYASRLQVQERLTTQICDFLFDLLKPRGVMVVVSAEHLCMSMRGVRAPDHTTTTSAIRGYIDKSEVLALMRS